MMVLLTLPSILSPVVACVHGGICIFIIRANEAKKQHRTKDCPKHSRDCGESSRQQSNFSRVLCYNSHEYGHNADHCHYPDGHSSGGQSKTKPELTSNFRGNSGRGRNSHSFTSRGRGGRGGGSGGRGGRGGDPTDNETENQITRKTDAVVQFVADESGLADEANVVSLVLF